MKEVFEDSYLCLLKFFYKHFLYISRFLQDTVFKVKLGQIFSSQRPHCAGISQGSTLSVTLFALKINSISDVIPRDVFASMYVDDVQLSFAHSDLGVLSAKLQSTVDSIARWAQSNGFTFSPSKTVTMQFYRQREHILLPELRLAN